MLNTLNVEQLIDDLDDPRRQGQAARILVQVGRFILNDLIRELSFARGERAVILAAIISQVGRPAEEDVLRALNGMTDPAHQRLMIQILGEVGDQRAIEPLRKIMESGDQALADAALDASLSIARRQLQSLLTSNRSLPFAC